MILHYLKIALRNMRKYKVQNLVSILSIAASATLLTVVGSFLGEFHTAEILDKPYADRVVMVNFHSPDDNPDIYGWMLMEAALSKGELQSVDKCFAEIIERSICDVTATVGGQERTLQTDTHVMPNGMMNWWGVRSVVTGGDCAEMVLEKGTEPGEVVMTERTARQLFGSIDVVGETIDLTWQTDFTHQHHTLRVADVVNPSTFDSFYYGSGIYIADSLQHYSGTAFMQLREGKTKADLDAELAERLKDVGATATTRYICDVFAEQISFLNAASNGIMGFLVLFLAVCVVGYMRMQAQLFRIRQRELALRTVVGARRWQLYAQFSVEVLIILGLAMALTLAFNTFMHHYLTENLRLLTDLAYIQLSDFTQRTLISFAVIAVLCLVTVALVIRSIRRRQTGLAMMMRPSRRSFASVATMSVQLFFSTFLMAMLVILFTYVRNEIKRFNLPENDDFYERCITLNNNTFNTYEQNLQLVELIEQSENVERVFRFSESADIVKISPEENATNYYFDVDFQLDREMFDFYDIEPVVTNPHANPAQCAYVHKGMMEKMQEGGAWERGSIDIMGVPYEIAGYFEHFPYLHEARDNRVIATNASRDRSFISRFVVVARPFRYNAALQDMREAYEQVFPGNLSFEVYNYRYSMAGQATTLEILRTLFAIVAAISLVTTIASIYSVISLDTRRRRKEVALRKVHGATARIIGWMFARRYVLICSACYLLLLPVLLLIYSIPGSDAIGMTWWQVWIITALIITAIVALTIVVKIWRIAKVNIVEALNS